MKTNKMLSAAQMFPEVQKKRGEGNQAFRQDQRISCGPDSGSWEQDSMSDVTSQFN